MKKYFWDTNLGWCIKGFGIPLLALFLGALLSHLHIFELILSYLNI